ncbi:MAG: hypothetical protein B6D41_22050 [Chloroflexi bacterium UTCFX4]|jgi:hypothetical protein|nr:MAG: hypothetical protein B6D41_22050 [Chloroflexi bacterium UTCFX4]
MTYKRREWLERLDELYDPTRRLARAGVIRLSGLVDDQFYYSPHQPMIELPQLLAAHFADQVDMFVWYKWGLGLQYEFDRVTLPNGNESANSSTGIDIRDPFSALNSARGAQVENRGRRGGGQYANNAPDALRQVDEHLRGHPNKRIVALFHQVSWDFPGNNQNNQNLVPNILEWPKLCLGRHLVIFSAEPMPDWIKNLFRGSTIDLRVTGPTADEVKRRLIHEYLATGKSFFDWKLIDSLARFFQETFSAANGTNVGYHAFVVQQIENRGDTQYNKEFLDKNQKTSALDYHTIKVDEFKTYVTERIIGQEKAKEWAIEQVRRLKKRGVPPNRARPIPLVRKLFAGPSGVGKTELARVISRFVFQRDPLIIAGTEYQLEHEVIKLLGAPPSYVGYGQPGVLTQYLQEKPYGVIVLDEFEKADERLRLFFMNALQEGISKTPDGIELNFGNTIVIATSNTGSKEIDEIPNAENIPPEQRQQLYERAIAEFYNQALLGRLDGALIFDRLTELDRVKIAQLYVQLFIQSAQKAYSIPQFQASMSDQFFMQLLLRCPKNLGARKIENAVSQIMEAVLDRYYEGEQVEHTPMRLDWSGKFPAVDGMPLEVHL